MQNFPGDVDFSRLMWMIDVLALFGILANRVLVLRDVAEWFLEFCSDDHSTTRSIE